MDLREHTPAELERLNHRLVRHAHFKMLRLTWRGAYIKRGGAVPGGYEPYDFVLDAIQKMLDGTRPWNKEKYGTVEEALLEATEVRFRPIVMTGITTAAGSLPLLLSSGAGAETRVFSGTRRNSASASS